MNKRMDTTTLQITIFITAILPKYFIVKYLQSGLPRWC